MKEMNSWSILKLVHRYEAQMAKGSFLNLDEESFHILIEYYALDGQTRNALFVAEHALRKYIFSVDFYIRKAELLLALGQEDKALDVLSEANTFAPGSVEINLLKAEALNHLGERDAALQLLDECKVNIPDSILSEVLLMESIVYEHHCEYDAMFDALKKAALRDPENNEAVERLGFAMELTSRFTEGITVNEAILDAHPYSRLAWFNLGNANRALDNYEAAIEAYKFVMAIDEKFEYAYHECASLYFEHQEYVKALDLYLELTSIVKAEDQGDLHFKIGACYHLLSQYSNAKKHLLIAQKTSAFQDKVFFILGNCSLLEGNLKEASYYYKKAISIQPEIGEYYTNLAEVKILEEDYEAARDNFEKAVSVEPGSISIWIDYIVFYFDIGHVEKAFSLLDRTAAYIDIFKVYYMRIALLFLSGKKNEGRILLWDTLIQDYDSHEIIFKIAPELEDDSDIRAIIAVV